MVKINSNKFTGFEKLPSGKYDCSIKSENAESKNGNPTLEFEFSVIAPEFMKGRKLFKVFAITDKALWALKPLLNAVGYTDEMLEQIEDTDELDFAGKLVTVEWDSDANQPYGEIAGFHKYSKKIQKNLKQ
jgi:hypothetical protein